MGQIRPEVTRVRMSREERERLMRMVDESLCGDRAVLLDLGGDLVDVAPGDGR
jgi:hypothetical protein